MHIWLTTGIRRGFGLYECVLVVMLFVWPLDTLTMSFLYARWRHRNNNDKMQYVNICYNYSTCVGCTVRVLVVIHATSVLVVCFRHFRDELKGRAHCMQFLLNFATLYNNVQLTSWLRNASICDQRRLTFKRPLKPFQICVVLHVGL